MVRIEDGGGKNGNATVSNNQRLDTSARSASRDYYESRDQGQVYTASMTDPGGQTTEDLLWLKNTSTTKDIVIDNIYIASLAVSEWVLKFVTDPTAATGTNIVPTNLNAASSNAATVSCKGGAAGVANLTDGATIAILRVGVGITSVFSFGEAIRLGQDDAIALELTTTAADGEITILFHFDSE